MTTLRSDIDQKQPPLIPATSLMTDENQHEVRCGMCARAQEDNNLFAKEYSAGPDTFRCRRDAASR